MWAIVKDSRGMEATGHAAAVRWARAGLELDEPTEPTPGRPRAPIETHTHGFTQVDGTWRCVQDYFAVGTARETGCGQVWQP
jgi:hypothetical protein